MLVVVMHPSPPTKAVYLRVAPAQPAVKLRGLQRWLFSLQKEFLPLPPQSGQSPVVGVLFIQFSVFYPG